MSSSGRYQSWLLNTVRSGSRQIIDRLSTIARHGQIAVVWGAQVVMYPIYLLFQGTRLVGRQLQQTVQQTILQLQARSNPSLKDLPASDKAIQQVMGWLQRSIQVSGVRCQVSGARDQVSGARCQVSDANSETFDLKPETYSDPEICNPEPETYSDPETCNLKPVTYSDPETCNLKPETCQGIASLLETRSLVLVDSANQLWDVLTAEQQQQLYRRLIWEVIDYDRAVQRVAMLNQGFSLPSIGQRRLPLPPDRPQALPSVRRFRNLMAWMQQSPVAIAINLFQEADLAAAPIVPSPDNFSGLDPLPASALIDPDAWCGEHLAPPVRVPMESWLTMADLFGTQDFSVQDNTGDLRDHAQNNAGHDTAQPATAQPVTAQPVEPWSREPLAIVSVSPSSLLLPDQPLPDQQELLTTQNKLEHGIVKATPTIVTVSPSQGRTMTAVGVASQAPTPPLPSTKQAMPAGLQGSPLMLEGAASSSSIAPTAASSPEHTPDWIETEAKTTGYVKHPLEQVLEWLDQLLTCVEAMGIAVWKMIRHRFNP